MRSDLTMSSVGVSMGGLSERVTSESSRVRPVFVGGKGAGSPSRSMSERDKGSGCETVMGPMRNGGPGLASTSPHDNSQHPLPVAGTQETQVTHSRETTAVGSEGMRRPDEEGGRPVVGKGGVRLI